MLSTPYVPPSLLTVAHSIPKGSIADAIIRKVTASGGIMTHEDLANYTVHVERALEGSYRGRKVYTTHAPTSGPGTVQLQIVVPV